MRNEALTTLSKKIILSFKIFRSIHEIIRNPFFRTHPPNVLLNTNDAFSTSFLKSFRQKTGIFGQPTKMKQRTFSSSKCSFRHIECSSDNIAKMIKKSLVFFCAQSLKMNLKSNFQTKMFSLEMFLWKHWIHFRYYHGKKKIKRRSHRRFHWMSKNEEKYFAINFFILNNPLVT